LKKDESTMNRTFFKNLVSPQTVKREEDFTDKQKKLWFEMQKKEFRSKWKNLVDRS